jgi:hypothetical protein
LWNGRLKQYANDLGEALATLWRHNAKPIKKLNSANVLLCRTVTNFVSLTIITSTRVNGFRFVVTSLVVAVCLFLIDDGVMSELSFRCHIISCRSTRKKRL